MLKLSFKQTRAEFMVRIASSLIFNKLIEANFPVVAIRDVTENVQYGYTEKAAKDEIGPKYVRITDMRDGQINWETVPYCKCEQPEQYLLSMNDLLFARTGATTGKTHLVRETPPNAVFASYLIRVRPQKSINPEYLYSFFQSDSYWSQISDKKEGSAQPNVNGQKLSNIKIPVVDKQIQSAINEFLFVVRLRQDGVDKELPELPPPLTEQRRIVEHIEALARRVAEALSLRREADGEIVLFINSVLNTLVGDAQKKYKTLLLEDLLRDANYGTSVKCHTERPDDAVPVLRIPNVASEKVTLNDLKFGVLGEAEYQKTVLQEGDILVVRTNGSADLVGRCAVVPALPEPMAFASYMIRIRCNKGVISPAFLQLVLRQQRTGGFLIDFARTTAGQYNVSLGRLRKTKIPIPPLEEQRRLVAYLDGLQAQVSQLRLHQEETQKELSALMPSILDKAFKGEL